MGFRTGSIARVWTIEPKTDAITSIRVSISRKDRQSGEYVQDFSGYVACIGADVARKASKLKEGDRIRLKDVDVSTTYNKDTKQTYTNYKCFSFLTENEDGFNEGAPVSQRRDDPAPKTQVDDGDIDDSRLPF